MTEIRITVPGFEADTFLAVTGEYDVAYVSRVDVAAAVGHLYALYNRPPKGNPMIIVTDWGPYKQLVIQGRTVFSYDEVIIK